MNAVTHVPGACASVSEAEGCGLWAVGGTISLFSVEGGGCHLRRLGNGQGTHWSPGARRVQGQLHRLTREGERAMTKYEASCLSGKPLEKQEAGSAGRRLRKENPAP